MRGDRTDPPAPPKAAGAGAVLSAAKPKNLLLAVAAAAAIATDRDFRRRADRRPRGLCGDRDRRRRGTGGTISRSAIAPARSSTG
jgi:hypothetical protein